MLQRAQAAYLTTLVTIRPLLGVSGPWNQISFMALKSRSTSASRSSLVEEVRPASSTPWASYGHVRGIVALW